MSTRQLKESRTAAVAEMRSITEAASGDLSDDAAAKFDALKGSVESLDTRIARHEYLDDAERRAAGTPLTNGSGGDGNFVEECRKFKLLRAIGSAAGMDVDAGREREVSKELARRSGKTPDGFLVPREALERRVVTSAGSGGNLIATDHRDGDYIDILRAKLITGRLGATVIPGLTGDVSIPRRTVSTAAEWILDNAALTATDPVFDSVTMAPNHLGGLTEISRNIALQSSPEAERLIQDDLALVLAEAIDLAAINGSGTPPVPEGILNVTGIGTELLATPTWAGILSMIETGETANAEGTGFCTNPHVVSVLRTTEKLSGSDGHGYIQEATGALAGYPLVSSTLVPNNLDTGTDKSALIFGNWPDLLIGLWGSFEILVNPYASGSYEKGNLLIRALLSCDVQVRHPESFVAAVDIA